MPQTLLPSVLGNVVANRQRLSAIRQRIGLEQTEQMQGAGRMQAAAPQPPGKPAMTQTNPGNVAMTGNPTMDKSQDPSLANPASGNMETAPKGSAPGGFQFDDATRAALMPQIQQFLAQHGPQQQAMADQARQQAAQPTPAQQITDPATVQALAPLATFLRRNGRMPTPQELVALKAQAAQQPAPAPAPAPEEQAPQFKNGGSFLAPERIRFVGDSGKIYGVAGEAGKKERVSIDPTNQPQGRVPNQPARFSQGGQMDVDPFAGVSPDGSDNTDPDSDTLPSSNDDTDFQDTGQGQSAAPAPSGPAPTPSGPPPRGAPNDPFAPPAPKPNVPVPQDPIFGEQTYDTNGDTTNTPDAPLTQYTVDDYTKKKGKLPTLDDAYKIGVIKALGGVENATPDAILKWREDHLTGTDKQYFDKFGQVPTLKQSVEYEAKKTLTDTLGRAPTAYETYNYLKSHASATSATDLLKNGDIPSPDDLRRMEMANIVDSTTPPKPAVGPKGTKKINNVNDFIAAKGDLPSLDEAYDLSVTQALGGQKSVTTPEDEAKFNTSKFNYKVANLTGTDKDYYTKFGKIPTLKASAEFEAKTNLTKQLGRAPTDYETYDYMSKHAITDQSLPDLLQSGQVPSRDTLRGLEMANIIATTDKPKQTVTPEVTDKIESAARELAASGHKNELAFARQGLKDYLNGDPVPQPWLDNYGSFVGADKSKVKIRQPISAAKPGAYTGPNPQALSIQAAQQQLIQRMQQQMQQRRY